MLESSRSIGKAFRNYQPFKRAIARAESGFWFIAFSNSDKMIGVLEVDLGIDSSSTRTVKEVRDERKRIVVFESPVQSGFFAFLGTTGPQPVVLPSQNGTTATGPLPTGCHRLCYQLQPVYNWLQLP